MAYQCVLGYGPTVAPRNERPKGSQKEYIFLLEKYPKANLSFEIVLIALGAWEYAGIIENGYSFAHANVGANP